ncbi:hypothetical protein GCM10010967_19080 [Dyadobacter beijingensis]|uniref:Secretion system C-terminal sorting domain-containing protein n=2 Tax=Dyadobacter beijingensis TaxID=365489 RepID=A0ABQ2HQ21_9BACT|nr:hypothetical protein GCM10010967_19080 [Dyadobacter beijingensis]
MLLVSGWASAQSQTREVFMCKDATLRIRAESTGAVRYEWFLNNQVISGSSSSELLVNEEGTYKAVGVNADSCESGESVYIVVKHHKPSAVNDLASTKSSAVVIVDVLNNDVSECASLDPASLTVVQTPVSGSVVSVNGKLTYTPVRSFEGAVTITYTVKDQTGQLSNTAQLRIDVVADPLPVKLAYFEVQKTEDAALLEWGTTEEVNSDYFDIERSADMRDWHAQGRVEAAGQSNSARNYHFNDSLPEPGLNYYRLKMVDADDTFTYSRVRSANFPEFSWAEVYPNPVDDQLHIVIRNRKVNKVRLISHTGIVRLSKPITAQSFTISMKQFPTGMYYIHFEQADGAVKIFKLMHN